jgi:RHS repeat-associated protein
VGAGQAGLGYTGEWWDAGVGLQYLRARWYAPQIGGFLSIDPIESEPPYQYVRGNPVNGVDPSGYMVFPWDVGTRQFYSCKCGWIDTSHAKSQEGLIRDVEAVRESERMWARLYSDETSRSSSFKGLLPRTISADFLVRQQGVLGKGAYEVAWGIMLAWETFFEAAQGYGHYRAVAQVSFTRTHREIRAYLAFQFRNENCL